MYSNITISGKNRYETKKLFLFIIKLLIFHLKKDFIELYIKFLLNYIDINDKIYVKSIYQIKNNDTILHTNINIYISIIT